MNKAKNALLQAHSLYNEWERNGKPVEANNWTVKAVKNLLASVDFLPGKTRLIQVLRNEFYRRVFKMNSFERLQGLKCSKHQRHNSGPNHIKRLNYLKGRAEAKRRAIQKDREKQPKTITFNENSVFRMDSGKHLFMKPELFRLLCPNWKEREDMRKICNEARSRIRTHQGRLDRDPEQLALMELAFANIPPDITMELEKFSQILGTYLQYSGTDAIA